MTEDTETFEARMKNWHKEWEQGFWDMVYTEPSPVLAKHFEKVTCGRKGLKILVPMSATTYDLIWLCELGHTVVGTDLAESAAQRLFKQYKQTPIIEDVPSIGGKLYKNSSGTFRYYVGDFFQFSDKLEGKFDFIWDSKAMCSVDKRDYEKYMRVIHNLTGPKSIVMLEFFKQTDLPGYFTKDELKTLYGDKFEVEFVDEGLFDMSNITLGDVDDDGNAVPRKDKGWRKDESGENIEPNFKMDTECYCIKKKD